MKFKKILREFTRCYISPAYFIHNYCYIENPQKGTWEPFHLWPSQIPLEKLFRSNLVCVLKARQLGLSWYCLATQLQKAELIANTQHLIFSKTDREAKDLLKRVKGMCNRLPAWLHERNRKGTGAKFTKDDQHVLEFPNGSRFLAFPSNAGDSYTAATALVDEADLVPDLNKLLRAVKPTTDNGGQLILCSRSNKDEPASEFKQVYNKSKEGTNGWASTFLPWNARPDRTQEWYEIQKQEIKDRTGAFDDLWEHYPNTDIEALSARILNKRFPPYWFDPIYFDEPWLNALEIEVPGFKMWGMADPEEKYVLGVDVAEGDEASDDSAVEILNSKGIQVGELHGRINIEIFSEYIVAIVKYYNNAKVLVERNNHGHAVITRLKDHEVQLIRGHDTKYGWLTTERGKAEMYTRVADRVRKQLVQIKSKTCVNQLMSLERATLSAPEKLLDDLAVAYGLACIALDKMDGKIGSVEII